MNACDDCCACMFFLRRDADVSFAFESAFQPRLLPVVGQAGQRAAAGS